MYVESRQSPKKSWQTSRERVTVLADLAIRKETVVRKLTEIREAHDLTQERAAAKVGVTVRQWQRWESGASVPYARNISAIAECFDISENEFFDKTPERPETPDLSRVAGPVAAELAALNARLDDMQQLLTRLADAATGRSAETARQWAAGDAERRSGRERRAKSQGRAVAG